jgi:hypothetical protein
MCRKMFPVLDSTMNMARHVARCGFEKHQGSMIPLSAQYKHCAICLCVFGPHVSAFELKLHVEECERVNGPPKKSANPKRRRTVDGAAYNHLEKSSSHHSSASSSSSSSSYHASVERSSANFESQDRAAPLCFCCGIGGRQLLSCSGSCSRSFHIGCVDENPSLLQRPFVALRKRWKCAECQRMIHTCVYCNMLGDDDIDIFPCSLQGCGFYAHRRYVNAIIIRVCPSSLVHFSMSVFFDVALQEI